MSEFMCRIQNIVKQFPGVTALKDVGFDVKRGEIHAIIGENGAGKSTLMNVLSGVDPQTSGSIEFDGKPVHFTSPLQAQHAGIAMIHQELSLARYMTVAENIFQGRLLKNRFGFVDAKKMRTESLKALSQLGVDNIDPNALVKKLSISQMQLVEIAKALSLNARMLIMDEPTSALTVGEIQFLLNAMKRFRDNGMSILFISHKLEEVLEVSDRITVLRDGAFIKTLHAKETDLHEMISLMVGRDMGHGIQRNFDPDITKRKVVLEVKSLSVPGKVKDVSFQLHEGEVLGLTGLVGAGRSELLQAIFGVEELSTGEIFMDGKQIQFKNPTDAIGAGIALVPENRKEQGLFLKMSVCDNMTMVHAGSLARYGFLNMRKTFGVTEKYRDILSVKTPSIQQIVSNLSGGNQQKTIIARWLMHNPKILLMDEPTHGIDVGAKFEIYTLIEQIAKSGVAVILLSSELPEVLSMSDRIMVMHHGELRGILNREEADQVEIMKLTLESATKKPA